MNTIKVVVIGNGMIGHHYIETLAKSDSQAKITVIGGESRPAYHRVNLSEIFNGKYALDLSTTSHAHYEDPANTFNLKAKVVTTKTGRELSYDELVVASPVYKQHFSRKSGKCLEEETSIQTYSVNLLKGKVICG